MKIRGDGRLIIQGDIKLKKSKSQDRKHVIHPFDPVFDENSEILILGSLPSVKSRENNFYYGHPQNRFWKVISHITNTFPVPETIAEKKAILLKNRIALWDVIRSCEVAGSSDSSISDVTVNDINEVIDASEIKKLYANGNLTYSLYMKHCFESTGIEITKLPSTSSANAAYSLDKLISYWSRLILFNK